MWIATMSVRFLRGKMVLLLFIDNTNDQDTDLMVIQETRLSEEFFCPQRRVGQHEESTVSQLAWIFLENRSTRGRWLHLQHVASAAGAVGQKARQPRKSDCSQGQEERAQRLQGVVSVYAHAGFMKSENSYGTVFLDNLHIWKRFTM